jgi:hypothetical protein
LRRRESRIEGEIARPPAPAPAAVDRDAAFTVKGVNHQESIAQALRSNGEFDQVREVPLMIEKNGGLNNTTTYARREAWCSYPL